MAIGIVLGAACGVLLHIAGIARERGTWAVAVAAIALFYVAFAADGPDPSELLAHAAIASVFVGIAVIGARTDPWWLVAALLGHGLFDLTVHLVVSDPSPPWWGPFCFGVDAALAVWLGVLVRRGEIASRPRGR